ncbi:astacin-like metalloendopeptidase isoform 2-T2 [Mantella aurantiaca]
MLSFALCLLSSASAWSLGLTLPVLNDQLDNGNDDDLTISDLIVQANEGVNLKLQEGDINVMNIRSALICNSCQWSRSRDGLIIVPYVISSDYSTENRGLIISALLEFATLTCVLFQERDKESNYLNFEDGQGCWSYIGRTNGGQTVSLEQKVCMIYGVIQHEVMHSLGFFHEHNRLDRDDYVDINWQYISPEIQWNFQKNNGNFLNNAYEYSSLMHYGSKTFVNTSGQMSIIPKPNPNIPIGQKTGFSNLDVKKMNVLYNCHLCRTKLLGTSGTFSSSDATPESSNDHCLWLLHVPSYLVLLQFSNFVCPFNKCDAKINVYDGVNKNSPLLAMVSAGQSLPVLISSGRFMLLEYITDPSTPSSFDASYSTVAYGGTFTTDGGSVVSPHYPSSYPNRATGTYVIIAPPGNQVFLIFKDFDMGSSLTCLNDYLEIRDGGDLNSPSLGVYCGQRSNLVIVSSGPTLLLQFSSNSRVNRKGFKADYFFVSIR